MKILPKLLAAILAVSSIVAQAAIVYDNGGPSNQNGYGISGTVGLSGSDTAADDFTLASTSVIQSVGFYFNNYNGTSGWDGNISYAIRNDASGSMGTVLASGAGLNVLQVQGGFPWCCGQQNSELVTFDLGSAFTANAGQTYWLELGGAGGPSPWWVSTSNSTGNNSSFSGDVAFFLDDGGSNTVPEPGTLALVSLTLFGLVASRRRKF